MSPPLSLKLSLALVVSVPLTVPLALKVAALVAETLLPLLTVALAMRVEILVQFGPTWQPKSSSKTGPPSITSCKLVHCNNAVPATGGGGWFTWTNMHAFDKPIAKNR